jgi:hypothetical protein
MDKTTTYIQEKIKKLWAINPSQPVFQYIREAEVKMLEEILRLHKEDMDNVKTN